MEVTQQLVEEFRDRRILLGRSLESTWLKPGRQLKRTKVRLGSYSSLLVGPHLCSIGSFSYSKSPFSAAVTIGRYCAIGGGVAVMPAGHPLDRLSTSGIDYSEMEHLALARRELGANTLVPPTQTPGVVTIGHDVWIGADALLGRGLSIGTGAVVAARSIVTKDVPPYAIVAGAPATVRRYRFPEATIVRLLASEWWTRKFMELGDTTDVDAFLDAFEAAPPAPWEQTHWLPEILEAARKRP